MILDSKSTTCFRVLREKELCYYGEYRTKLQIMEIYDRMQHTIDNRLSLKVRYAATNPPTNTATFSCCWMVR